MPELYFDIKFRSDKASKRTIADELNQLQQQADKSAQASATGAQKQTQATQKQVNAEKELIKEFRRKLTLNEVQFRQGKLSQKQALEQANAIETQAIEQGILTNETLQGVRAQKTMFLSQQRINTGFTGMAQTSARANQSLMNLGRIVQDLPFGFLGISNNIDPALNSFQKLKEESGGTGSALKQLLMSLKGSGGLIFALGSLLPSAILIAQKGMNFYAKRTDKAKDAVDALKSSASSFVSDFSSSLEEESIDKRIDMLTMKVSELGGDIGGIAPTTENITLLQDAIRKGYTLSGEQLDAQRNAVEELTVDYDALKESVTQANFEAAQSLKSSPLAVDRQKQLEDLLEAQDKLNDKVREELEGRLATAKADKAVLEMRRRINKAMEVNEERLERDLLPVEKERIEILLKHEEHVLNRLDLLEDQQSLEEKILDEKFEQLRKEKDLGDITKEQYKLKRRELRNEELDMELRYKSERDEITETERTRVREAEKARREMINNMPSFEGGASTDESRGLAAQALIGSMQSDIAVSQAEGLAQKKLEIEQKFERERLQIIKQFGTEAESTREILRLLDIQKKKEFEDAKTKEEEKGEKERQDLRQKALDQTFASANNYISSLMKLNQAQSDQSEAQARKRFETQKKLAIAQAVVDGAAAAVKTWKNMGGYPTAIPFVAAQVAATATQIAAIRRTQFESGGSQAGSTPSASANEEQPRGFFITDVNEEGAFPLRPSDARDNQIVINVENRLDKEGLAMHVKEGNERVSSRNFTVISNG